MLRRSAVSALLSTSKHDRGIHVNGHIDAPLASTGGGWINPPPPEVIAKPGNLAMAA
jgi:hypothetical protein